MVHKQIYNINNQSQLIINLPESFRKKKKLMVIVDDSVDSKDKKLQKIKLAANDPLFLSDINEITDDFEFTDKEVL